MGKKLLVIPDVHGRPFWKKAFKTGNYEKIIFLGDYIDSYAYEGIDNQKAISNFKDILSLKMFNPDKVILLLGNHDLCYLSDRYRNIAENDRYDYEHEEEIQQLFRGWSGYFKLAHEEKISRTKYLFSHAGVTMPWLKRNSKIIGEPDAEHLNPRFVKSYLYKTSRTSSLRNALLVRNHIETKSLLHLSHIVVRHYYMQTFLLITLNYPYNFIINI